MGKNRNRQRRRSRELREAHGIISPQFQQPSITHESASPVLRLVRSEERDIPSEQDAAGLATPAIAPVRQPERSNGVSHQETSGNSLDSAIDTGSDDGAVLVTRSFDAADINAIFNDPSVFPLVSVPGIEKIDVTELLKDPRNVLLMGEGGGILFCWHDIGTYEVHTAFLPQSRGRNALKVSLAAYRWMFTHTDCWTLLTKVPAINPAAEKFCQLVGATKEFERKNVWPTLEGMADMSYWSLCYDDWIRKTPSLKQSGRAFHVRLEQEFARHGAKEEIHPDEDCHDLHVGACAEMIYGGQLDKAILLYNRWASFAGYRLIGLVSRAPAVIDIGNSLLQITGDTFKVIRVN